MHAKENMGRNQELQSREGMQEETPSVSRLSTDPGSRDCIRSG